MSATRYRDIILFRTYASLKAEAQRTYLGSIWWLIEPILNTLMFYVIFYVFLGKKTENAVQFLVVGNVIWQWFGAGVGTAGDSIQAKLHLLQQIYLPKFIFPIGSVLITSWKLIFVFAVTLVYLWFTGMTPNLCYLALPVLAVLQLALIIAVAIPLSVLIPYFPDGKVIVDALMRTLMFASGIFFAGYKLPADVRGWFYINPMAHLIESYRDVLMYAQWPQLNSIMYVTIFDCVALVFAFLLINRFDRSLVKVAMPAG